MAFQSVLFNGTTYSIPTAVGDLGWAGTLKVDGLLISLASYAIPNGGTKTLVSDLNLGPTFGLVAPYYKSTGSNISTTGVTRLSNLETVSWRNYANSADLAMGTNAQDRLTWRNYPVGPFINVRDFGAKGDASTDDTVAIQAALDYATVTSGGTVFFPAGPDYIISNTLDLDGGSPVILCGEGATQSKISFAGSNAVPMLNISHNQTNGCEVHNLMFQNNGSATIAIDVHIGKTYLHHLFFIPNSKFSTCAINTYQTDGHPYYVIIRDSIFQSTASGQETPVGIKFGGSNTLVVDGCFFSALPVGVEFVPSGDGGGSTLGGFVTNCRFESFAGDNPSYPGSHTAVGIYADHTLGLSITACSFGMNGNSEAAASGQLAIDLHEVGGCNISGNSFQRTGTGTEYDIKIGSAANGIFINGNTFHDMSAGVTVVSRNSNYECGTNYLSGGTPYVVDDSATPSWTSLTEVVGGGTITKTLNWSYKGDRVFFVARIGVTGGATTAATTSTYVNGGGMPPPTHFGIGRALDTTNQVDKGAVMINTNGNFYMPGWVAASINIVVTGDYLWR